MVKFRKPQQSPYKLQCLHKWARPCLRDIVQLPKVFVFSFFALNTKTTKISLYKLFFFQNNHQNKMIPPKSKQNKILSSVNCFSSKMKAIRTQPCDWEGRGLIYLVTTLAGRLQRSSGQRTTQWVTAVLTSPVLDLGETLQTELQEFCKFQAFVI